MNLFVVTHEGQYWLFYGGADAKDRHCICLATCPVNDVTTWTRHGPIIEPGEKGAYSIGEATSTDGLTWERGAPGENLSLPPGQAGWETHMTAYPNIVREGDQLRLFYCGNGYGKTGIGTATAAVMD